MTNAVLSCYKLTVMQAVWNNWCALMVISLTKISLEGVIFCFFPLHYPVYQIDSMITLDLYRPLVILSSYSIFQLPGEYLTERWVSHLGLLAVLVSTVSAIGVGTAIGRIRFAFTCTCVHCRHRSWYCNWPYKV